MVQWQIATQIWPASLVIQRALKISARRAAEVYMAKEFRMTVYRNDKNSRLQSERLTCSLSLFHSTSRNLLDIWKKLKGLLLFFSLNYEVNFGFLSDDVEAVTCQNHNLIASVISYFEQERDNVGPSCQYDVLESVLQHPLTLVGS
ncbi:hypothetical protein GWI33_007052 [Rhynchophorus ferrugineus]|uniref:Uncharacterized protein n=1 Tax=Rhynchophorus ferrugineus TaxID=354439 RepID=A0A834IKA2_RHYFE|nr:hypothetical protein GWI33_007052 [Rhynchophorus ferrugineus]